MDTLWRLSTTALIALNVTELGTVRSAGVEGEVWTGTTASGEPNGDNALGTSDPMLGSTVRTDAWWVDSFATYHEWRRPMYALSGPHVVPGGSTVPTLGSYGLMVLAFALAGIASRRVMSGRRVSTGQ